MTSKKAKDLAKEAGYTGTPIRLLVSTNYQAHYDEASVFTRQLADAGINVQMMVVDWATLLKMRGQSEQWDIFVTHHTFSPDPILFTFLNATYPGWWNSPEIQALRTELTNSSDQAARKATWDKIQALIYQQVPVMKVGDAYTYDIASPKLKGLNAKRSGLLERFHEVGSLPIAARFRRCTALEPRVAFCRGGPAGGFECGLLRSSGRERRR